VQEAHAPRRLAYPRRRSPTLYETDDQKRIVLVVDVGHRSAIYR
jgi:hypothetical protein